MNNLLLAEQSLPNFFSFLFQKARPGLFFVLVCFLATYGCSTPRYYRFQNKIVGSIEEQAPAIALPDKKIVHHGMAEDKYEGPTQPDRKLDLVKTPLLATARHSEKKNKKEAMLVNPKTSGWNQFASANKTLHGETSDRQNDVVEEPSKKNKAAKASFTMFMISILGVLGGIAIAPEFFIFVSLLIPATICGYIALSQIKKTGELGKGKALFTAIFGTGLLLLALTFLIYLGLEGGEW